MSLEKTAEPIEMLFGEVGDSRMPKKPCIKSGCTLAPPGEYDKSTCLVAAMRSVATTTVATCF